MRVVVQRVNKSSVKVDNEIVGSINKGFNVLVGIGKEDTIEDLKYMKDKVLNLRVFEDEEDKMNLSLKDVCGELLLISQFTLYGDCRKGRRPNFMNALGGDEACGYVHVVWKVVGFSLGVFHGAYEVNGVEVCAGGEHLHVLLVALVYLA